MSDQVFRVVIADDVADLRLLVRKVLERTKRFEVVAEAQDGREAIAKATEHRPDLTLLDLSMPVMDGLEALPHIRAAVPESTVVVLSGFDADRMADQAMEAGAAAYLVKGLHPAMLVDQLLELLSAAEPEPAPAPDVPDGLMVTLPAALSSARQARRFVKDALQLWSRESVTDEAMLLTTELVTNAVVHAGSAVELRMVEFPDRVRVEVADRGAGALHMRQAEDGDISGRGLMLVEAMAMAWGTSADGDRKVVWFEV